MRDLKKGDRILIRGKAHRYRIDKVIGEIFWAYIDMESYDHEKNSNIPTYQEFNQNEIIYYYTKEDLKNEN